MSDQEKLAELLGQLELTPDNRLLLGAVPMVLMPRWFFVGIMKLVAQEAGLETAARVYYRAGWEGAYAWAKVQMEKGLLGRAVLEQYLGSMTFRGWGRFSIAELDLQAGQGRFEWHNSALALEMGETDRPTCLWGPGAMAGAMQAIIDHGGAGPEVAGREVSCRSAGAAHCTIVVEPAGK